MNPGPTQKTSASILREEPGRLILDAYAARRRAGYLMLIFGAASLAVVLFLFLGPHSEKFDLSWWIAVVAFLAVIQVALPLDLILRGRKTIFDLDQRRLIVGKTEIYFDDIVALVFSTGHWRKASRKRRASGKRKGHSIGSRMALLVRGGDSLEVQRVESLCKGLAGLDPERRASVGAKLESWWEALDREGHVLVDVAANAILWQAAARLCEELRVPLLRFDASPVAFLSREVGLSLVDRLRAGIVPLQAPGDPPDAVIEERTADGLTLRWKRPKKRMIYQVLLNALPLVIAAIFAILKGKDMEWRQLLPVFIVILLLVPVVLLSLFGKLSLEVDKTHIRTSTRLVVSRTKEMPLSDLTWIQHEATLESVLHFIGREHSLDVPMAGEVAAWTRKRLEAHLAGGTAQVVPGGSSSSS